MLASRRIGTGPRSLVLLHGFLGRGRNLAGLARHLQRLRPDLSLVLPDLPGHGDSPAPPSGVGLEAVGAEVLAFLETILPETPLEIAGHSFGARVALAMLARAPERVARVAMLDMGPGPLHAPGADRMVEDLRRAPASFPDRPAATAAFEALGHAPEIARWIGTNLRRTPRGDLVWSIDRALLARMHEATRAVDLWPVVERLGSRIALLRGAHGLVGVEEAERLRTRGVAVTTLEECGHFLHVERPEAVAAWLVGWLRDQRASSAL